MKEKIIEFKDVSFSYGQQPVLENATFDIEKGDFVGVIGPNGAGKTTVVKLLLKLLKPDSGSIRIFGKELSEFRDWHKVGYVPQKATNFDQNFPATVFEVAGMGRFQKAGLARRLSGDDYKAVEKALKVVGILPLKDSRIGDLSGGQQQRAFIARALAAEPELLILDEPTVGVDMNAQHEFYALLKKLNKELGMTLLLVSHDVGMITKSATKLMCVNISVTFHDISKGFDQAALYCTYVKDVGVVPHHHDHSGHKD